MESKNHTPDALPSLPNLHAWRSLSPARRRFLELIARYEFARIENVDVINGEPLIASPVQIFQEIKIGGERTPPRNFACADVPLPAPFIELFERLREIGTGRIVLIDVRHHLPFRVIVERSAPGGSE